MCVCVGVLFGCIPSVEEEGQPEAIELVRHVGVEEGKQAAHIGLTVNLHTHTHRTFIRPLAEWFNQ